MSLTFLNKWLDSGRLISGTRLKQEQMGSGTIIANDDTKTLPMQLLYVAAVCKLFFKSLFE